MSIKDITIVITSFKSKNKIKKCLNSIDKECSVINIENSNDQDFKKNIESEFSNVRCILAGENLGYGKANNIGLKAAKTKYALILNPDTELYPQTLESFLLTAHQNPDFAIIGPNIIYAESKKKIHYSSKSDVHEAKNIKGFAMFLNLSQFEEIGFFDESFFIYLEEIDLCRRLIKNNKKIYWGSNIPIYHQGGQSHDEYINYQMELSRNWHWMWSTFYYNKKYKGFFVSLLLVLPKIFSATIKIIIYALIFNQEKKKIYYQRLSGLFNAIIGKDSWYRPKV
jgi:N-acetylglucosaminyl-diphospho-decaprenol L-rhamnosyltransferase